jgi:alkanesulfonate monooxygenase SsuD/methylene tetrahydromethanopterin reductase-like flavin-dependent oxidoreductase (luciferase family)
VTYEVALQTSGDYDELLGAARWAEHLGLAAFAVPDHYLLALDEAASTIPAYDALTQLAALARDTARIRLAVLVSPVTFRHPAVLAKTALTIDALSGGRFSLGIGTGWLEREHEVFGFGFPPVATRFQMLEESLAYVRAVFDGAAPGFAGELFRLEPLPTVPHPIETIPIIVGGVGARRTPRLAGMFADEYNCYPAPPDDFAARVDLARRTAVGAGRDPDALMISSSGAVLAAETRNAYEARLAAEAAEGGTSVEDLEAHMRRRNTPHGTFDEVAAQLDQMASLGMRRFYLQRSAGFDREEAATLIAALLR